ALPARRPQGLHPLRHFDRQERAAPPTGAGRMLTGGGTREDSSCREAAPSGGLFASRRRIERSQWRAGVRPGSGSKSVAQRFSAHQSHSMEKTMSTDVLIAGAGPTGLVLALWLTKLGVKVRIVDKTAEPGTTSRALAVQARTLELYRQLDLTE